MASGSTGRKHTSNIYDFFVEQENDFEYCVMIGGKVEKQCCTKIKKNPKGGGNTGNLKRHLSRSHPKQFAMVEKKDIEVKKSESTTGKQESLSFLSLRLP